MRLKFEPFDDNPDYLAILDEDTGNEVGMVQVGAGMDSSGIDVSLFDGKYQIRVKRYDTAIGFVLGVQSVLNHMTSCANPQYASKAA
ncbi:MAG TPA: hypothetical protein VFK01_04420 [Bradyrhizobium sp.]|jgi:hypothetical protein|nr:hypothetical protein [Bradyrhizobium sp.]